MNITASTFPLPYLPAFLKACLHPAVPGAAEQAPPRTSGCISAEAFKDNCCSSGSLRIGTGKSALILLFLHTSGVWSVFGYAKNLLT